MVKYILQLLFILFVGYISYDYGYKTAFDRQSKSYIKQLEDQQTKFKKLQKEFVANQLEKENEIKAINSKHSIIVSSLRNRPERVTIKEVNNCTSVCSGTGSTGEQLFREDAEFLIGEASKAEILKQSLLACRRNLIGNNND